MKNEDKFNRHPQFDRRQRLNEMRELDERVAPWRGTAYGVIAAVNTYEHHIAAGSKPSDRSRAERNAVRALNQRFDQIDIRNMKRLQEVL